MRDRIFVLTLLQQARAKYPIIRHPGSRKSRDLSEISNQRENCAPAGRFIHSADHWLGLLLPCFFEWTNPKALHMARKYFCGASEPSTIGSDGVSISGISCNFQNVDCAVVAFLISLQRGVQCQRKRIRLARTQWTSFRVTHGTCRNPSKTAKDHHPERRRHLIPF